MIPNESIDLAAATLRPLLETAAQDPDVDKVMRSRDKVLARYQPVFAPEHVPDLTADEFQSFVQFDNNCHWTGLSRKTAKVCDDLPQLKTALLTLLDESQSVGSRVDTLSPKGKPKYIKGFGKAVVTAILHVAYPAKYGVWNNTSEEGMKIVRVWPKVERGATDGERYEQINAVLNQLSKAVNIDLWTLDALWWRVKVLNFPPIPEEVLMPERYKEGASRTIAVNAYERNPAARQKCIDHYGYGCAVCERSLVEMYGSIAEKLVHVHHLKELAAIGEEYEVDPVADLRPVCPNCHAVLHSKSPALSINRLRKILAKHRKK
jgi:hypothetical protein